MITHNSKIGLDHIAFYSPSQFLSLEDLALARGVEPEKFTKGIGITEISIPSSYDDVITLAANAGQRVLEESGISPDQIGLLIVGTESAVDKSKPVATHVHELLTISGSCRVFDITHACIGATYGVLSAMDWVSRRKDQYALVIAADIAAYERNSPGEPTQGAGAIAMLICCAPRIMGMQEIAAFSKNVYDFWKPLDMDFPIVKGVYSTQCYLNALKACYSKIEINPNSAFFYHSPYPSLVKKAHQTTVRMIGKDLDWTDHYDRYVSDSLILPSKIGNIYTGSLWLTVISLLESIFKSKKDIEHVYDGAYLFSYGSGCGSALIRAEFQSRWAEMAKYFNYFDLLTRRKQIDIDDYEKMICSSKPNEDLPDLDYAYFKYTGIKDHQRTYEKS